MRRVWPVIKKQYFLRWYVVLGLLGFSVILPVKGVSSPGEKGVDSPLRGSLKPPNKALGKDSASGKTNASVKGDASSVGGNAPGKDDRDLSNWVKQISKKSKQPVELKRDVSSLNEAVQDSQKQREGIQKEMQVYWEEAQSSEDGDLVPEDDQKRLPASARDFDEYQIRWEKSSDP